jgi:putative Mg2+ transporter-C (MgtC) family protein
MEVFLQLILATVLGGLVGLEREYKRKEAGLRTHSLVSLGAALFTIISLSPAFHGDPLRVIQAVALGIGFIGAGLIIHRECYVEGLTTAAGLWVAAGIGLAVGAKLYLPAIFVTLLAIGILAGLRSLEEKFIKPEKK